MNTSKLYLILTLVFLANLKINAQSIPISNDSFHFYGPNSTWNEYLQVGGNGRVVNSASVVATNGNLHLDSKNGFSTFINHYSLGNTFLNTGGGNVGIGTATPRVKLDVVGKTIVQNALQTDDYMFTGQHNAQLRILSGLGVYGSRALEIALLDNGIGVIQANESGVGYNTLSLNPVMGDVGIGTTNPKGYKLAVNGNIRAKEIKVETANWPDYVFHKSYQLPSLQETEKHINEKGHLPGIPSAADVKTNGIDLGEMNAKLLQKIEELTLHLIEQQKKNEIQNGTIKQMELRLEKLENLK